MNRIVNLRLPGLDVKKVNDLYEKGYYNEVLIPRIGDRDEDSTLEDEDENGEEKVAKSTVLNIRENTGSQLSFLSTNIVPYSQYMKQKPEDSKKSRCMRCFRKFDWIPLGIPVAIETSYRVDGEEYDRVYCRGSYCGFRCMYAKILELGRGCERHQHEYMTSESIMWMMFEEMYPELSRSDLEPSLDISNLEIFNGTMSYEEYFSNDYRYIKIPGMLLLPETSKYQKLILN